MNGLIAGALGGLGAAGQQVSGKFIDNEFDKMKEERLAQIRANERQDMARITSQQAEEQYQRADRPRQELLAAAGKPVPLPDMTLGGMTGSLDEQDIPRTMQKPDLTPRRMGMIAASLGRPADAANFMRVADNDMTESEKLEKQRQTQIDVKGTEPGMTTEQRRQLNADAIVKEAMPGRFDAQEAARLRALAQKERAGDERDAAIRRSNDLKEVTTTMRSLVDDNRTINTRLKELANDPASATDAGRAERTSLMSRQQENNLAMKAARERLGGMGGNRGGDDMTPEQRRKQFLDKDPVIVNEPPRADAAMDEDGYWKVGDEYLRDKKTKAPLRAEQSKMPHTQGRIGENTSAAVAAPKEGGLGADFDTAKQSLADAQQNLQRYGTLARKNDPAGYAAAQRRANEAQREFDAARGLWEKSINAR